MIMAANRGANRPITSPKIPCQASHGVSHLRHRPVYTGLGHRRAISSSLEHDGTYNGKHKKLQVILLFYKPYENSLPSPGIEMS